MDILRALEESKRKHFVLKNNKIRCTLTGHEMPCSQAALLSYVSGKKFCRALAQRATELSVPAGSRRFLIDARQVRRSRRHAGGGADGAKDEAAAEASSATAGEPQQQQQQQLFCQLTCRFVANTPADVARHVSGRRFRTALAAYEAALAAGRSFRPNTSLFAKFRGRYSLQGLEGVGSSGAGRGQNLDEEEASTGDEDQQEDEDSHDDDDADEDEEMLELEVEPGQKQASDSAAAHASADVAAVHRLAGAKRRAQTGLGNDGDLDAAAGQRVDVKKKRKKNWRMAAHHT